MQVDDKQLEVWQEEQRRLASSIVIPNHSSFTIARNNDVGNDYCSRYKHILIDSRRFAENQHLLIGGVDVAFPKDSSAQAIAVYIILSYSNFTTSPSVIYRSHRKFKPPPYISSYLSFRESPALMSLITKQLQDYPEYRPDLIMVDGNGVWHERRAGLACFIGQCGIPCIGIGKSWYSFNGQHLNVKKAVENCVKDWYCLSKKRPPTSQCLVDDKFILFDSIPFDDTVSTTNNEAAAAPMEDMLSCLSSEVYGLAIPMLDEITSQVLAYALLGHGGHLSRLKRGSKNPIYISIGNNITLQDAVALVASTCGTSRIPEAVREADIYGRSLLLEGI